MAKTADSRFGFPLGKIRAFERDVQAALETVALEASRYTDPLSETENVRRTWTSTLATLGAEATDAAIALVDRGDLRMVMLLVRSLYEYSNKATYYSNHIDEARLDARAAWAFRVRMIEVAISDFSPTVEPLDRENKVKVTPISNIVNAITERVAASGTDAGDRFRRHYHDGFYAYSSAIAHGGPGAINDVFRFESAIGEEQRQVWLRRRPESLKVIGHAQVAFQSWLLLFALTALSPVNHAIDVDKLLERWSTFDAPLLAFKQRHIDEVGFEQAALDSFGT